MKKFLSLVLVSILVFTGTVWAAENSTLEESNSEPHNLQSFTTKHVKYMFGLENGNFEPNSPLTRGQAAAVVYALLSDQAKGEGDCSYKDVPQGKWFAEAVTTLCSRNIIEDGELYRPNDSITRKEFVVILAHFVSQSEKIESFSDVTEGEGMEAIEAVAEKGWVNGYADGTFRPEKILTRSEACAILNRATHRKADPIYAEKLIGLGLYSDVSTYHWAADAIAEASVVHEPMQNVDVRELWNFVDLGNIRFTAGVKTINGALYCVDKNGKLVRNDKIGAFLADENGVLTQRESGFQMSKVPYISQIDGIGAWTGCEATAALMGLKVKGYAGDVSLKTFLDAMPRSTSNPEKGFVGSPYASDKTNRLRTTIYPAKLADYCNSYGNGDMPCADARGYSVTQLRQELLAGNCMVAYMTLWWKNPYYSKYNIEGQIQSLVNNNHAVLVCGYDPEKGYFISDPYNYYGRNKSYQYWQDAKSFEAIWDQRKVGMIIR